MVSKYENNLCRTLFGRVWATLEARKVAVGALEELSMAGEQQQEIEETVETVRLEVLVATIRREVKANRLDTSGGVRSLLTTIGHYNWNGMMS